MTDKFFISEQLGERIRERRKQHKKQTQEEFANSIKCSRGYYGQIEAGGVTVRGWVIATVAHALEVEPKWFGFSDVETKAIAEAAEHNTGAVNSIPEWEELTQEQRDIISNTARAFAAANAVPKSGGMPATPPKKRR